jgi:hypothetical protein
MGAKRVVIFFLVGGEGESGRNGSVDEGEALTPFGASTKISSWSKAAVGRVRTATLTPTREEDILPKSAED